MSGSSQKVKLSDKLLSWKYRDDKVANLFRTILWIVVPLAVGIILDYFEATVKFAPVVAFAMGAIESLIAVFQYHSGKITDLLDRQEIIVKIDIQEFDNDHIKPIQEIFDQFEQSIAIDEVFVIDSSHPAQWLSESMLAFLAIQSYWLKTGDNKVHRFFLLNESERNRNDIKKIISLQVLLGFNTYLIFRNTFYDILNVYNKYKKEKEKVQDKEFLVWNGIDIDERDTYNNPSGSATLNSVNKISLLNKKVVGYQSLWYNDTPHYERKDGYEYERMNGESIDVKKWDVKFEFILPDYLFIRNNYIDFSKHLISLKKDCSVSSAINKGDKVIHIPRKSDEGMLLDTDIIYGIVESFYNNR